MKKILIIILFSVIAYSQSILVINSNSNVEKYNETIKTFKENFKSPYQVLNITNMTNNDIKEALYDIYPDIVYAVGVKAYQYVNRYIPEKIIFFSSIVNYKRLPLNKLRFGISNELHSGMKLMYIKSIFQDVKTIGVVYSKYTKNIVEALTQNAKKLGIKIISKKIDKDSVVKFDFDNFVKNTDGVIIIPDPIFLSDTHIVKHFFSLTNKYNKPVFAYNKLFISYGAVLVVSIDNPTVGRQMATMIQNHLDNDEIKSIQYPAGTEVIFDKKVADKLHIQYNNSVSYIASEIIE